MSTAVSSTRQSGDGLIDERGLLQLSMLKGQGLPTCMVALSGLNDVAAKRRSSARKLAARVVDYHFGNDIKQFPLDSVSDGRMAVRHLVAYVFAAMFQLLLRLHKSVVFDHVCETTVKWMV